MNLRVRYTWFKQGRTNEWWRDMVSGDSDDNDWKKNFRMSRELFHELLEHLVPYISPNILSPNRIMILADKKLVITLCFFKGYRIFANGSQHIWYSFIYCIKNYS